MIKKTLVISFVLLLLSGCATNPQVLGMSPQAWQTLTKQEQDKLFDNYNKIKADQQLPTQAAVGYDQTMVELAVSGGTVMMPPFIKREPYQKQTMTIVKGTCNSTVLYSLQGSDWVEFKACYYDHTLYLDPSRYNLKKLPGSAQLVYSPIWKRGFTYQKVSTSGYARLKDANIHVKLFTAD